MGCGSCGSAGSSGKASGCGSGGGCSSGGCNRLNVFDWLADLPPSDFGKPFPIFEVSFNNGSRKEFFLNSKELAIDKGLYVTVEGTNGFDVGVVSLTGELVKLQLKKYSVKEEDVTRRLLRIALESDMEQFDRSKLREKEILVRARSIARSQQLDMKIGEVELQADGKKLSVYYTANNRVDFRELLKVYALEFNARIEMRQIGARQESGKIGGIGSCGRELCCSTWLTDFKTVYTSAARYQNLSINQTKLSGQCGKLKCCLNYELDTYMDALTAFPNHAEHLMMKAGKVKLVKKDIFKKLMWYSYEGQSKQYPLNLERVREIIELNKENVFPDELEPVEIISSTSRKSTTIDAGFVNDVGQISLNSLTRKKSKSKSSRNSKSDRNANSNRNKDAASENSGRRPQEKRPPREQGEQNKSETRNQQSKTPNQNRKNNPRQKPKNENQPSTSQSPRNPKPKGQERRNNPRPKPPPKEN